MKTVNNWATGEKNVINIKKNPQKSVKNWIKETKSQNNPLKSVKNWVKGTKSQKKKKKKKKKKKVR